MRKILCDTHHAELLHELDARDLGDLISRTDEEEALRIRSHGFDPAVGALTSLLGNIGLNFGFVVFAIAGCPFCLVLQVHADTCTTEECKYREMPSWPAIAAEEQLATWRILQLRPAGGHS